MKIKLMVFGYSSGCIEEEVQLNHTVSRSQEQIGDLKTRIMKEKWPKDIRQLRIFYNGKELLNSSKIKSAIVVEKSAEPIEPVLQIMATQVKSGKGEDEVGEFSCSCRIL